MTPQQWERVQELFERGLGKTPDERAGLLWESVEDAEVARQLEELWANEDPPPSFLDGPPEFATPTAPLSRLLDPGETVAGRFCVLELIGRGGMGEVYRARDERLQRIVALKVLPEHLASDATHRNRLEREARAVSSLSHPRICALHDCGADGGFLYLVLEYLLGETLDCRLRRGPIPESDAVAIALQICEGLRHAHESAVIHRDLKPGNIMLTPTGVKLLDFGIATKAAVPSTAAVEDPEGLPTTATAILTGAGLVIGTPSYMSPEQASGLAVDARSDIFAFGAVIFEMIAGRRAFPRSSFLDPSPTLPAAPGGNASPLQKIVAKCLERDPGRRYGSVAELEQALCESLQRDAQHHPRRLFSGRQWYTASLGLACVAALGVWLVVDGVSTTGEPRLTSLTSYPGTEYSPTLSPDGRNVAFLWDGDSSENFDVYVQPLGSERPLRLTSDPASEKWPQWSPDGQWIGFTRENKIVLISPFGGPERVVGEMAAVYSGCDIQFSWTADSRHIIYTGAGEPGGPPGLHALSVETQAVRAITTPEPPSRGDWCPALSHDGRRILYTHRMPAVTEEDSRHVASLGPDLVLRDDRPAPWIKGVMHTWAANGYEVLHVMNRAAGAFLFRTAADTPSEPKQLPYGEEGMFPTVARTGDRMVYMKRRSDIDIYSIELRSDGPSNQPTKISPSSRIEAGAEYSPEGSRIAFYSERTGRPELWIARPDGSQARRVAQGNKASRYAGAVPRWSPDGKRIVYGFDRAFFEVDVETGNVQRLADELAAKASLSYSRDGQWIYFSADDGHGSQIWRMPAAGGVRQRLTTAGGYAAVESFDGRELYFLRSESDQSNLFVMPAKGGAERLIARTILGRINIASTVRGLYFIGGGAWDERSTVYLYRPDTRGVTKVVQLSVKQRWTSGGLAVSPDQKRLLYSAYDMQGDLMLVDNFR